MGHRHHDGVQGTELGCRTQQQRVRTTMGRQHWGAKPNLGLPNQHWGPVLELLWDANATLGVRTTLGCQEHIGVPSMSQDTQTVLGNPNGSMAPMQQPSPPTPPPLPAPPPRSLGIMAAPSTTRRARPSHAAVPGPVPVSPPRWHPPAGGGAGQRPPHARAGRVQVVGQVTLQLPQGEIGARARHHRRCGERMALVRAR